MDPTAHDYRALLAEKNEQIIKQNKAHVAEIRQITAEVSEMTDWLTQKLAQLERTQ